MNRSSAAALALALAFPFTLTSGCVSTTGTLQTAETVPKDDWQVGAGLTVPVSTRFVGEVYDLVSQAHDELTDGEPVTDEEEEEALVSALAILLFQPAVITPLSLRRGTTDNVDFGLRLAGPALRLDAKWRFARTEGGTAFAVDVGGSHHTGIASSIASSLYDIFESLELVGYSRNDLDINLLVSTDPKQRIGFFGAARYAAAFTSVTTRLDDAEVNVDGQPVLRDTDTIMHAFGGSGGVRVGNERVSLLLELTVMRILFRPDILGEERNLGGYMVEPSVGLTATF